MPQPLTPNVAVLTALCITPEQTANLVKLAAYLRTLPEDYPDFEMNDFVESGERIAHVPECGTAGCAAGHGPRAGIEPLKGESWYTYSCRAFCPDRGPLSAWDWCFEGAWSDTDNTVHGAAARIEYMLVNGVPDDADDQRCGEAPLSYRASVSA